MSGQNGGELVTVDFYGDSIQAVERDGKVWAVLRVLCAHLGVSMQGQLEKLKGKSWAILKEILAVAADGRQRSMVVIDLKTMTMWLANMDERKVPEHVRLKLIRYQQECADALADHFLVRRQPAQADQTAAMRSAFAEVMREAVTVVVEEVVKAKDEVIRVKEECHARELHAAEEMGRFQVRLLENRIDSERSNYGRLVESLGNQQLSHTGHIGSIHHDNVRIEARQVELGKEVADLKAMVSSLVDPPRTQDQVEADVERELLADPHRADSWIGALARTSNHTVVKVRRRLEKAGAIPFAPLRSGQDGRKYKYHYRDPLPKPDDDDRDQLPFYEKH